MEVLTSPLIDDAGKATSGRSRAPLTNPFAILVDSAEQAPFTFQGIYADSDRGNCEIVVAEGLNLFRQCLGRHPHSLGDYSIEGFFGRVAIERKSMDDAHGTFLGWSGDQADFGRRQRFEQELANLANVECSAVVVECSLGCLLDNAPSTDNKTAKLNRKILNRSLIAWTQDYGVPFVFCDSRRMAELYTFRFMERFYEKHRTKRQRRVKK
jgi:hypothetical protein